MTDVGDSRGILHPARLPTFARVEAPPDLHALVRWFWIPRWRIQPGRTSRQEILPFPASNLVVQPAGVTISGPSTGASHRDLTGTGWAVGGLLRPAAVAQLHPSPGFLRDVEEPYDAPDLHAAVVAAMATDDEEAGNAAAAAAWAGWAREHLDEPDEGGEVANAMEDLVATDPEVVRVEQVAERLGLSVRAVQRLCHRYVGLPPLAVIRRYRLQEAARRLREDEGVTVTQVAAELGYADHAHLTRDFGSVLGLSPQAYRRDGG